MTASNQHSGSSDSVHLSMNEQNAANFQRLTNRVFELEEQLETAQSALREIAEYECEPFDSDIIEAHVSAAYNDLAKIAREALNPASGRQS